MPKNSRRPCSGIPLRSVAETEAKDETVPRIWGQFEFQLHNEAVGPAAQRAERLQLMQKAWKARNEACGRRLATEKSADRSETRRLTGSS
jgi:hypothetical protein